MNFYYRRWSHRRLLSGCLWRILSREEETRLFDAIRSSNRTRQLEPTGITALATGIRVPEILNLKWSNVDLANRLIIVEGTKSGYIRKIPMNTG